jgi:hypothetical protein
VTPAPPMNKSRLETFMIAPLLMATEAANLDMAATMAAFAIRHLHAIVRCAPEPGNGMAPNVAAVAADAVLFVNSRVIGFAVISMALRARQTCPARVNRVREPNVRGLARVNQPGRFLSLLHVLVHQQRFILRRSQFFGVASGAHFRARNSRVLAVAGKSVAAFALRLPGFCCMGFVQEVQRLLLARVESPGESDPTNDQSSGEP